MRQPLVVIRVDTERARLSVTSSPLPAGAEARPGHGADAQPGHGIVGMVERAEMAGGALFAGLRGDSWVVEALLPSPHEAADSPSAAVDGAGG